MSTGKRYIEEPLDNLPRGIDVKAANGKSINLRWNAGVCTKNIWGHLGDLVSNHAEPG